MNQWCLLWAFLTKRQSTSTVIDVDECWMKNKDTTILSYWSALFTTYDNLIKYKQLPFSKFWTILRIDCKVNLLHLKCLPLCHGNGHYEIETIPIHKAYRTEKCLVFMMHHQSFRDECVTALLQNKKMLQGYVAATDCFPSFLHLLVCLCSLLAVAYNTFEQVYVLYRILSVQIK